MKSKWMSKWLVLSLVPTALWAQTATLGGVFEGGGDIGIVLHPGSVRFDASSASYVIAASGENLWGAADAFHFVWKKMSGDVTLGADISFPATTGDPHKKAVLMVRQTLDADSAYADIALHGNGLTSLQARESLGGATHEIQSNLSAPKRLRIEKRGDYFYMYLPEFAGGSMRVPMKGAFYVGIGVSAHNKDAIETAVFSNIAVAASAVPARTPALYRTLETITVRSTDRRVSYVSSQPIESPNWSHDGASLIFNAGGKLRRVPVEGGEPQSIDTGVGIRWGDNHGISPDGTLLAVSGESGKKSSAIYIVSVNGGLPRLLTKNSPSWFHGWSPDGKTIVFSGERNHRTDLYTISVDGGDETRLTKDKGLNDAPEYSPDGRFIYFDSNRTGSTQIWRRMVDGTAEEQITNDDWNNSFPHVSPDGKRLVFLSYDNSATGLPESRDVMLRSIVLGEIQDISVLAKLVGGKGSLDSPSWSPDSRRLAFVSYQSVP